MQKVFKIIISFLSLFFINLSFADKLYENKSWEDLEGPTSHPIVSFFSKSPIDDNLVYAGSLGAGSNHVFKSLDGGHTWGKTSSIISNGTGFFTRAYISPNNKDKIYATIVSGEEEIDLGLYLSEDAGNSWEKLPTTLHEQNMPLFITDLKIDPKDSNVIYITSLQGIYKSNDSGQNWIDINTGIDTSNSDNIPLTIQIAPKNSNILYASLGADIYKSINYGSKWEKLTSNKDKVTYQIALDPNDLNNIYTMSVNMKAMKHNFDHSSLNILSTHKKLLEIFSKLNQDKIKNVGTLGLTKFINKIEQTINTSKDQDQNNDIDLTILSRSYDAGKTWKNVKVSDNKDFVSLFIDIDIKNSNKLLVSYVTDNFIVGLIESTDKANSFVKLNLGNFEELGLHPIYIGQNSDILFGGIHDIYYGTIKNNIISFEATNSKFINTFVSDILVPGNSNDIYTTAYSGFGKPELFHVKDSAFSISSFNQVKLPVSWFDSLEQIAFDYTEQGVYTRLYYAGASGDLYKKEKLQDKWELLNSSIIDKDERGITEQLLLIPHTDILFAKTDYSSLYRSKNGGVSWSKLHNVNKNLGKFNQIIYDSVNKFVYLATTKGLYVSKDLGDNFEKVIGFKKKAGNLNGVTQIEVNNFNANQLYILVNNKLYRSDNLGKKWIYSSWCFKIR